jgi:hypothetical protein
VKSLPSGSQQHGRWPSRLLSRSLFQRNSETSKGLSLRTLRRQKGATQIAPPPRASASRKDLRKRAAGRLFFFVLRCLCGASRSFPRARRARPQRVGGHTLYAHFFGRAPDCSAFRKLDGAPHRALFSIHSSFPKWSPLGHATWLSVLMSQDVPHARTAYLVFIMNSIFRNCLLSFVSTKYPRFPM